MDQIINLNVGGKLYTTSLSTLTKYPDSMLGRMFSGDLPSTKDVQGNYVIDRDGKLFRYILTFLRSAKLILPDDFKELGMLLEEAEFFQIAPLIEEVRDHQEPKPPSVFMLNVGGTVYPVLREYLEPDGDTLILTEETEGNVFAEVELEEQLMQKFSDDKLIVSSTWRYLVLGNLWDTINNDKCPKDQQGNYIINGDPTMFRHILNFIRYGTFHLPKDFCEFALLKWELKRLQMYGIENYLPKDGNSTQQNPAPAPMEN